MFAVHTILPKHNLMSMLYCYSYICMSKKYSSMTCFYILNVQSIIFLYFFVLFYSCKQMPNSSVKIIPEVFDWTFSFLRFFSLVSINLRKE